MPAFSSPVGTALGWVGALLAAILVLAGSATTPPADGGQSEGDSAQGTIAAWTFEEGPGAWRAPGGTIAVDVSPGDGRGKSLALSVAIPEAVATLSLATDVRRRQLDETAAGKEARPDWDRPDAFFRWRDAAELRLKVFVPQEATGLVQLTAYLVDGDLRWYQTARPFDLGKGRWNALRLDLSPGSVDWAPLEHAKPWSGEATREVAEIGFKVFGKGPWRGTVHFDDVAVTRRVVPAPPLRILNFRTNAVAVPRYGLFEVSFALSREYDNPFDPRQVEVEATFSAPSGRTMSVPGFYTQDYSRRLEKNREVLIPRGRPEWKVRFAPREIGEYVYTVRVRDGDLLESEPRRFTCTSSDRPGPVRVSEKDPQYFEFENGEFFYPIGHNIPATYNVKAAERLGLHVLKHEGTFAYDRFLEGMARAGENFARIWLASWSFGLEWTRRYDIAYKGLGRYNLENAWRLDYVLEQCRRRGIYVQLALTTFGHYRSAEFEGDWSYSPYNQANGGPLSSAAAFWSDPRAQESYRRMLRYVTARWGYDTTITSWELCNEIDLVDGYAQQRAAIVQWHRDCAAALRRTDQGRRLITTSFANWTHDDAILSLPEISYSSTNRYETDVPSILQEVYALKSRYRKPAIVTETGQDFKGAGPETTERYIPICIWSSYMMPFAGSAMQWWWDFIDDRDLYFHFRPLVAYARGEDRRGQGLAVGQAFVVAREGSRVRNDLPTRCLKNRQKAYVWVYDRALIAQELAQPLAEHRECDLVLNDMADGEYFVEHWDTTEGRVLDTLSATASRGALRFPLPAFRSNMAVKVKPAPAKHPAGEEEG